MTSQDIEDIIYLGLKEVASDQRYACVENAKSYEDEVKKYFKVNNSFDFSFIENAIQNS